MLTQRLALAMLVLLTTTKGLFILITQEIHGERQKLYCQAIWKLGTSPERNGLLLGPQYKGLALTQ